MFRLIRPKVTGDKGQIAISSFSLRKPSLSTTNFFSVDRNTENKQRAAEIPSLKTRKRASNLLKFVDRVT